MEVFNLCYSASGTYIELYFNYDLLSIYSYIFFIERNHDITS